ncbi:MAG: c-type cytochrome [Rhodospirillales bacterium]|nr:c-type cytochrome [Rhodospirillales bacterium]
MHPLSLRRAALLPTCLFAAFVLLAQTGNAAEDLGYGGDDDIENPLEGDAAAIEHGKERYGARCGFCHGSRGIGAKGPCLSCNKFKAGGGRNLDIYSVIAAGLTINGRPTQMGGFSRTLSDDDIWSIIAYLRQEYKERLARGEFEEGYNPIVEEAQR